MLLPVKSVGVMGDGRTYENAHRASAPSRPEDFMTADWARFPYELLGQVANRIINEVHGVNRVVYDVSQQAAGDDRVGVRVLAAVAVLACLVFWSWLLLRRNERLLPEATRRAERLGLAEGASFDEDQCFEAALERSRRLPARVLDDLMINRLQFERCLEASRFVPGFCDGVPPLEDPRATADWQMDRPSISARPVAGCLCPSSATATRRDGGKRVGVVFRPEIGYF